MIECSAISYRTVSSNTVTVFRSMIRMYRAIDLLGVEKKHDVNVSFTKLYSHCSLQSEARARRVIFCYKTHRLATHVPNWRVREGEGGREGESEGGGGGKKG